MHARPAISYLLSAIYSACTLDLEWSDTARIEVKHLFHFPSTRRPHPRCYIFLPRITILSEFQLSPFERFSSFFVAEVKNYLDFFVINWKELQLDVAWLDY